MDEARRAPNLKLLFHGLILLCLRLDLDFDLWKSKRLVLCEDRWGFDQVDALLQFDRSLFLLLGFLSLHSQFMMSLLPGYSDFINLLDCLQSVFCEISVVSLWPITLPLKLKGRVLSHILPVQPPVGLCPFYFTRISFHLEVLVAFGSTEAKNLGIVANKLNTMAWIYGGGAKPTLL